MFHWAIFLGLGAFVGTVAALAGIGGGLLLVPGFLFLLPRFGVSSGLVTHMAIASSLAVACLTSIVSGTSHARRNAVEWRALAWLMPGLVGGGLIGGIVAGFMPEGVLRLVFAVIMLLLAGYIFFQRAGASRKANPWPLWPLLPSGVGIGIIGVLVGIGGGAMMVPLLMLTGREPKRAIGTSAAAVFATVATGAVTYIIVGSHVGGRPAYSLGYLFLPAIGLTAATSMLFAPLGARLAHYLPSQLLRRIFAVLLVGVGLKLLLT